MEEEIKEEVLDSPLVVHKESDASYHQTAGEVGMNVTHIEEEAEQAPTLERHRFKKDKKKKKKKLYVLLIVFIAVVVAIVCALFYSGAIGKNSGKETTTTPKKIYATSQENEFEGIIVVKGTYIFFEGKEVDGISGLEKKIKYLDAGTKFVVEDENADSNYLNYEVLSLLSQYSIDYDITHIVSSGLTSVYETTQSTTKKSTKKSSSKKTTTKKATDN